MYKVEMMVLDIEKRPEKRLKLAIPLILLASVCLALMATVAKMGSDALTAESMIFWRNFVSLLLLLPWLQLGPPSIPLIEKIKTKKWGLHLTRGICSFLSVYLYFYSLKFLDLTSATLLFNTIPIFVPIVAFFWHRIVIQHRLFWAIGLSFLGIALVLHPGVQIFQFASFLALLSGIIGAVAVVSMRFGHYTESSSRILFYLFVICTICPAFVTLFSFEDSWQRLSLRDFKLLIPIGIFGFLYQVLLTGAVKFAPIRLLSPFLYSAVIFTLILDKWIWHIPLSMSMLFGFFCIVAGVVLMLVLYPKEDFQIKSK